MDPVTTAALIQGGSSVLSSALKGGGPAGPSYADSGSGEAVFDNSGWTVNFGDDAEVNPQRQQLPAVGGGINTTVIMVIVGALVAWKIYNKRK